MKRMIKEALKNGARKILAKAYAFAASLWDAGTVDESLKIVNRVVADMEVHNYQIVITMPQYSKSTNDFLRTAEICKLAGAPLGICYPELHRIEINLFRLALDSYSFLFSNANLKEKILTKVEHTIMHELRHAQQFNWLDTNKELRDQLLAGYKISVWSLKYWRNPLEMDARRYARTGEHVPFEVVFKDYLK